MGSSQQPFRDTVPIKGMYSGAGVARSGLILAEGIGTAVKFGNICEFCLYFYIKYVFSVVMSALKPHSFSLY
jgi:hypothetical protein